MNDQANSDEGGDLWDASHGPPSDVVPPFPLTMALRCLDSCGGKVRLGKEL